MHPRRAVTALLVALAPLGLLTGLASPAPAADAGPHYRVTIARTENGTPHITAPDYGSLGYGYAYAFATDDICTMADDYVTVDAQRSLSFGADSTYAARGNGTTPNNLNSDVFWQTVIDDHRVERLVAAPFPQGPRPEIVDLVHGYVAGWNRYLADVGGTDGISDPTCKGKPWVRPIDDATAWRRFYQLTLLASKGVVIDGIGSAQPPLPGSQTPAATAPDAATLTRDFGERFKALAIGSNAVAVGAAGTADHTHGLLLGNPHFPWLGTERFYQAQLTVPGQMDVEGASLYGVPIILIGHTADMAWSHTVSTAYRFTPYELKLTPGDPTSYLLDGVSTPMTARTVSVRTSASTSTTRTLYSTRYGPVFTSLEGLPFPWTTSGAYAMRDVNEDGLGSLLNHFFDTDHTQSAAGELAVLDRYQGIPWVNTIVADRTGHALYADIGAVPNVTDTMARTCASPTLGLATFTALGLPTLDGSRAACDWATDADSTRPGIFGPSEQPHLFRDDYVTNSNDSYWLANPHAPLAAEPRIIGDHDTARSLRTRIGLIMTQDVVDHGGFTRQAMQDEVFSDRQYAGELVRDDLVTTCRQMQGSGVSSGGATVSLGDACDVLAGWDLEEDTGSRGALLFRRFWAHAVVSAAVTSAQPFLVPFSSSDPVHTPNTLNTALPTVRTSLADAVHDLQTEGVALDTPLSLVQFSTKGTERIPIPGGPGTYGDFNAINVGYDPAHGGYPDPPHGSSYVQVVTWHDATGCPDTATILTYGESANPTSPYYADQTRMFSTKSWATERFCAADVAAHTASSMTLTAGADPVAGAPLAAGTGTAGSSAPSTTTRPTHRHPSSRPATRPAQAVRAPSRSLAATGLDALVPGAAALLVLGGLAARRRRSRLPG